jgi:hypothetical protein
MAGAATRPEHHGAAGSLGRRQMMVCDRAIYVCTGMGSSLAANKAHYDETYDCLTVDVIVQRFKETRTRWADVLATDTSWRGLYRRGFPTRLCGARVIELGSGDGVNALVMASFGATVTAVDIAEPPAGTLQTFCRMSLLMATIKAHVPSLRRFRAPPRRAPPSRTVVGVFAEIELRCGRTLVTLLTGRS